jgi:2-oxoglutarate dehydrogenase E2 component (dihydrolipoamide succinyltransferase)
MPVEIKVPAVGESISEGTVARWLKQDGDAVRADEPLFELETEKATQEIVAPAAGRLHIRVPEGQTVAVGTVVGSIEAGDAARPAVTSPATDGARKPTAKPKEEPADSTKAKAGQAVKGQAEAPLSPAARHLIEEKGLDVHELKGTGPRGRILKEDVLTHLEQRKEATPATAPKPAEPAPVPLPVAAAGEKKLDKLAASGETRQRMSSIRQRISERLVAAQHTAAILTTFNEADLSAILALRERYKESFLKKHGVGLGFMSFFVKAALEALRAFPTVNAWIDGNDIVHHNYYHIGIAVSTERGLMVPVVRDADRLTCAGIEKRIAELAGKARDGKIAVDDLQGGTFTITNGGLFGSLLSTPILNPPQSAILGMHTIQKRPVAVNDQVVIRPMMYLALSYDHRLIDGREAVQFLVRIKEYIESPERLLLEV